MQVGKLSWIFNLNTIFSRVDNFKILCTLACLTICVLLIKHHMTVTKTTFLTWNLDTPHNKKLCPFYIAPLILISGIHPKTAYIIFRIYVIH